MNGPAWRHHTVALQWWSRSLSLLAFVGALMVLVSSSAFALQKDTWKNVSPSRDPRIRQKPIGCGYFWDKDHGLIGSGVRPSTYATDVSGYVLFHPTPGLPISIYYTTDGGETWGESKLPLTISGAVTQISMVDSLEGYASIFSDVDFASYRTWGGSSLWKTTDGGRSWFDPYHLDHLISSVYAQKGLIVFTQWDSYYSNYWGYPSSFPSDTFGGHYSFDNGATWQQNFRRGNGIAFSDALNGVVTEMNDNVGGWNFWVTVDGGHTWDSTTNLYEAWSVYAVPGERTYYVASESQDYLPHSVIYRSTDAGYHWRPVYFFPDTMDMRFTGTIAGKGSTLYVQSDTAYDGGSHLLGMYRSDNKGVSWHWVGGPANSRDSRFVVTGCSGEVVYAFDAYGGVWKTEDGGDGTLDGGNPNDAQFTTNQTQFIVTPQPCTDSMQFTVYSTSCVPVVIDSVVQVSGSDLVDRTTSLPKRLLEGDSLSIELAYSPLTDTPTTSLIRVYAHAGYRRLTQDVQYDIHKLTRSAMILSQPSLSIHTTGCSVASDSVYLGTLGCPGMILDSVIVDTGELHFTEALPDTLNANRTKVLSFLFAPDSSGVHDYRVRLRGHMDRRILDTIITVTATAVRAPEYFVLSDTSHSFVTKYCESSVYSISLGTTSCDSVFIDSIRSASHAFIVLDSLGELPARLSGAIRFAYAPDSVGRDTATVRIFAHSRYKSFDTLITLYGTSLGNAKPLELSDSLVSIATSACQSASAAVQLTNQGCEDIIIDSIYCASGEFRTSFDRNRTDLKSNDTLAVALIFSPDSGGVRSTTVRVLAHSGSRTIDTIIAISATNSVAAKPLGLSSDTLYLATKYCEPVDGTISLENFGCPSMIVDSVIVSDDQRHEFSVLRFSSTVSALSSELLKVRFDPDTSGRRSALVRIYAHLGDESIDTVLTLIGRNFTAPAPNLVPSDSAFVGTKLLTSIYFRPTTDTFAIHSFSAHLAFNTDILTPRSLAFDSTCSPAILTSSLQQDATGALIEVTYVDSLRDTCNLNLPVVRLVSDVSLARQLTTPVLLDHFSTDRKPALALCSVPVSEFTTLLRCGEPIIGKFMQTGAVSLSIDAVRPNPIGNGESWKVTIGSRGRNEGALLELYDLDGSRLSVLDLGTISAGRFEEQLQPPKTSGDYFLVLRSLTGIEEVKKVSVVR